MQGITVTQNVKDSVVLLFTNGMTVEAGQTYYALLEFKRPTGSAPSECRGQIFISVCVCGRPADRACVGGGGGQG